MLSRCQATMSALGRQVCLDRSRILVKATNWLGDVIIGMPALRALRRAAPDAHLAVMVRQELASLLAGARWIDEIIPYRHPQGIDRLRSVRPIVATIQAGRYDWAILFPSRPEAALWMFLARVPRRVGYALYRRGPPLTHKVVPSPAVRAAHQVHWYLELLRQTLGIEGEATDYRLDLDPTSRQRMEHWLAQRRRRPLVRLAALAPAAAYGPSREWGDERYAELIDRLDAAGWECVVVRASPERARCEEVSARSRTGVIVAAGEYSLGELPALLSLCQGFIGNDSGAMHVAAALGLRSGSSARPRRSRPGLSVRAPACSTSASNAARASAAPAASDTRTAFGNSPRSACSRPSSLQTLRRETEIPSPNGRGLG